MFSIKSITGAGVVCVAIFFTGFYAGKGDREIQIQEKVVNKEAEAKTLFKDRIVTVTKIVKPDGTVIEQTKAEDKKINSDVKTQEASSEKTEISRPALSNYSLGLFGKKSLKDSPISATPNLGVSVGRRMIGELWLKVGVIPAEKEASVGIELQF
jgi:hypothetical protein